MFSVFNIYDYANGNEETERKMGWRFRKRQDKAFC
jgi:hypothetical protein